MKSTLVENFPVSTTEPQIESHLSTSTTNKEDQHHLGYLPLLAIATLSQVRQTYDDIELLADELALNGEINPVQVRICGRRDALDHLAVVNELYGSRHTLFEMTPLADGQYAILISGHRRTKAKLHLWEHGCTGCNEANGKEATGVCYGRHFPLVGDHPIVEVSIYGYISTRRAMSLQCRENLHRSVPSHEQAAYYDQWFVLERRWDPHLSAAAFARSVGANAETVRRARRYCRLPESLRTKVDEGKLGFGLALAIGRSGRALGYDSEAIEAEAERVILDGLTCAAYEKSMKRLIAKARAGESTLFSLGDLATAERSERRAVFDRRVVSALHGFTEYFHRALPLLQSGEMGNPGVLFRDTSTLALLHANVEVLRAVSSELDHRLSDDERVLMGDLFDRIDLADKV